MKPQSQLIVTPAQLGNVLQTARKSRQMTQAQLGTRLGLSQGRISELELSPGMLSVDQLLAVCAQLGLQLSVQPNTPAGPGKVKAASTSLW